MSEKTKSSVYLEQKCEALEQVIDFFAAMQGNSIRSAHDKLLIFLAQMDFWDWEMDNLIYSFTNFKERSKAWSSNPEIAEQLLKQGMLIKSKLERDLGYSMGYNFTRKNNVVAPWNVLKRVILKWNDLLKLCEDKVMAPQKARDSAIHLGASVLPDLSKFRKDAYKWLDEE